jgi:hypothetical protein
MANYALPEHFASFFGRLNPSSSFESTASSQYNTIKGLIESSDGPASILQPTCFLQGSYRQKTSIHAINDVDIVALCKLWYPGTGTGKSFGRNEIFDTVAAPLLNDARYRAKVEYRVTSMCIKVDLGIKVEILPVVYSAGNNDPTHEPFKLYRPSTQSWEDGFARYHQSYLSLKNKAERTEGNFIPAVKIFKHLRSITDITAVSFHLECLLYAFPDILFLGSPVDYIPALLEMIGRFDASSWYAKRILTPCGDRDIFTAAEWNAESWVTFHARTQQWSRIATAARDSSTRTESIRLWKMLLNPAYFPD